MNRTHLLILLLFVNILVAACNSTFTQKPKGYFEIKLPERKNYNTFSNGAFSFEYPDYAVVLTDSSYFGEKPENPFSLNIEIPSLKCKFYLSYKIIGGAATYKIPDPVTGKYKDSSAINTFDKLLTDAFDLSSKNAMYKSAGNGDSLMRTPQGISGIFFKAEGNAASPMQFFLSDSTKHFLRGSVYFDASPNADSTRPVTQFLYPDLQRLVNSVKWK
jgi:gliding motility-associated lipoprotein GldD